MIVCECVCGCVCICIFQSCFCGGKGGVVPKMPSSSSLTYAADVNGRRQNLHIWVLIGFLSCMQRPQLAWLEYTPLSRPRYVKIWFMTDVQIVLCLKLETNWLFLCFFQLDWITNGNYNWLLHNFVFILHTQSIHLHKMQGRIVITQC